MLIVDEPENADAEEVNIKPILPDDILEIFEFLSLNKNIIFKSQQIDDPELESIEKLRIAESLYEKNRHLFLMRFGGYFEVKHLNSFARTAIDNTEKNESEEMDLLIQDFHKKLQTKHRDVKNRRFTAMQDLIKKGEYFSEIEMMKRAPALYQELIGQYLSEDEKKLRDSYDVKNTTFSGILMHDMEQKEVQETLNLAEERNRNEDKDAMDEDKEEMPSCSSENTSEPLKDDSSSAEFAVPLNYRQQWGNFDNEQIACSTSRIKKVSTLSKVEKRRPNKPNKLSHFITGRERDLLRQEFIDFMHEEFLSGKDTDFDYSKVDDDADLDDLKQLNQDKEDAYFNETSEEDEMETTIQANTDTEASEDDLDIYMTHLNQHHSFQN